MFTELHVQNIKEKVEKEGGRERERKMEGQMQELWFELTYKF